MNKGLFISFEGGEGSGKTTIVNNVKEILSRDYNIITTREPGGTFIAEKIRKIILDNDILPLTEALLFAAARHEHVETLIKPAVNEGSIVMTDRYLHSSIVYQGIARNLGEDDIEKLNMWATNSYLPDITFYLNINPEEGLKRISVNDREINRLDKENLEFHLKVKQGFDDIFKFNEKAVIIDANKNVEEITDIVIKAIKEVING